MKIVLLGAVGATAAGTAAVLLRKPLGAKRLDSASALPRGAGAADITPDTILIRNPAFSKSKTAYGTLISTRTGSGKTIAYRLEEESEFVWDMLPDIAHQQKNRVTVADVLSAAAKKYAGRPPAQLRDECTAFLVDALTNGVLMNKDMKFAMRATLKR